MLFTIPKNITIILLYNLYKSKQVEGSDLMRVANVEFVKLDKEIPVYDVVNTNNHNFLIPTNDGRKIISHNCGLMDEVDFAP